MATAADFDRRMMLRAIALARRGEGLVEPNPMVGCVIVQGQEIVGQGFHGRFGGPHAEVEALRAAGERSRGSTLYVTLEPCCHFGKTPPCTTAILQAQVQRVVVAQLDPFAQVAGAGLAQLRAAHIAVDVGTCAADAAELNAPYLKRLRSHEPGPWVIAKWAMTLDGKIASRTQHSRWISNERSRAIVHRLRGRMDAIIVGRNTAAIDDPQLTARPPGPRTPTRIVLASRADVPSHLQLIATARHTPVLIAAAEHAPAANVEQLRSAGCEVWQGPADPRQRLTALLADLAGRGMTNVLVEGGASLLGSLFDQRLVDEVHVFIAARILGGDQAVPAVSGTGAARISEACALKQCSYEIIDSDLYVCGRVKHAEVRE